MRKKEDSPGVCHVGIPQRGVYAAAIIMAAHRPLTSGKHFFCGMYIQKH